MPDVTVCLVSLPERHQLLIEALGSVAAQARPAESVLAGVDARQLGEAANMNRLVAAASTEWVAFLHDDDLWSPQHLETGLSYAGAADVVVASFTLAGRPAASIEPHHCNYADLEYTNWFPPSVVLARRQLVLDLGGFVQPDGEPWIDWATWKHWHRAGARFTCTHEQTVTYRFGPWGNGSWKG